MKRKLLLAFALFFCLKSFSQENPNNEILLFPNTASTEVNLILPSNVIPTDISVHDLSGRLIKNVPLNNNSSIYHIDTSEMTQGMYIVVITTPMETKVKKFIVDPNSINSYGYYINSFDQIEKTVSLVGSSNSTSHLKPKDDAYLQGSTRFNSDIVRVDLTTRKTYLKYDLSEIQGNITGASLEFTIASDPGSGTISIHKGNGTSWTENNLSTSNRPSQGALLGSINKSYSVGNSYTITLSKDNLGSSLLSLVVVHSNGNDTDFASKEHATYNPPTLVITHSGSEDTGGTGNIVNGITLSPKDDAYLQGSTRFNTDIVRVDNASRKTYLKYDLSTIQGSISSASLKFTIASDPGSGIISVYKGNGTSWTEYNLSTSNRPSQGALLGSINKSYSVGSSYTITLSKDDIGSSLLSLVVVHSNGNDTDFASKEHATYNPPQLIINGGGD